MSASSYRPLSLIIGTSTKTNYLTPNSVSLYNSLDSRGTLSFQLRMPTSIDLPEVGQPVYLAAGTSNVYTTMAGAMNSTFGGELYSTGTGYGWINGKSSGYWEKRIDGPSGAAYLTANTLKFVNAATSSNQILEAQQARFGYWSSNAIPIEPYTNYRVSVNSSIALSALNGGYTRMAIYTGSASTMGVAAAVTDSTTLTGSVTLTTDFYNSTNRYMDVRLGLIYGAGTVAFSGLTLEKITQPYIFGGQLDSFKITQFPFTSYRQLDCETVDFSQMVGKRVVYKSYLSSGLGGYTLTNTSETYTGDGVTRAWALTYPTASSVDPTITLNGLACDTTAYGGTSTHGYYYTPSSNFILGNTSNSAPATTDSLKVVYKAQVPTAVYDSDIIQDIGTNFLDGECIDARTCITKTASVSDINFNYIPADSALNTLSKISGNSWYVDPWRRIHYTAPADIDAPFNITSTTANYRELTVKHTRDRFRDRQYILGSYVSQMTTESFPGDGYTRTWTVSKPIQDTPMVKIDGYSVPVGVYGVATSTMAAYWNKATNQITTNSTNTALASTDWITIQYPGLVPAVGKTTLLSMIAARAEVESNSGIYENVDASHQFFEEDGLYNYGYSLIERYAAHTDNVTFETDYDGLAVGMRIHISLSDSYGLSDYYLITAISARDVDRRTMRYKVTCVSGYPTGSWFQYFQSILTDKQKSYGEEYENLTPIINDVP